MEPGSVITPGSNPEPKPEEPTAAPVASEPQVAQSVQTEPTHPEPAVQFTNPATAPPQAQPMDPHAYSPLDTSSQEELPQDFAAPEVSWSASEYIAHHKNASWYAALAGVGTLVTLLVFLITQDVVASAVFPVVTVLLGVFAARKPQVLQYAVQPEGIIIGSRQYAFEDFRSFSVHQDDTLPSAFFWPTKRFMTGLTIYFPPDQADEILNTVSVYLPHEEREPDPVDRLMRRVRF